MTEGRPHWSTRRDANQADIVAALRQLGFCVLDVSPLGGEILDLFVCGYHAVRKRWEWLHVEVKTATGELTAGEQAFLDKWPQCPAIVARRLGDILEWFTRLEE